MAKMRFCVCFWKATKTKLGGHSSKASAQWYAQETVGRLWQCFVCLDVAVTCCRVLADSRVVGHRVRSSGGAPKAFLTLRVATPSGAPPSSTA